MKLNGVKRQLGVFRNDDHGCELEIVLDTTVQILKEIVHPKENDVFLYLPYVLNADQICRLIVRLDLAIKPDFKSFSYVLECIGIYNNLPHP